MSRRMSFFLVVSLSVLLVGPAIGWSEGPPWIHNNNIVPEEGCSCHGAGNAPSAEIILSISGVPRVYELNTEYNFTITLTHSSYNSGGFMIWDYGAGNFTKVDGTTYVDDSNGALSQNAVGNGWVIPWSSPTEDIGDVNFALAGNVVDLSGNADAGDHWTTLAFLISAPGTSTADNDEDLRTISVGDYDSLFGQKTAEEIEAERQSELANDYFTQGNLYFWTTLSLLIVAAVIQGEFYERRFGGGPPHLDMSLAVPQGIRRGVMAIGLAIFLGWGIDTHLPWGYNMVIGLCMLWAIFGVYRTIVQARAEAKPIDQV